MNNWLQNIKGQITELATEVLHEATEEGQVSTTSELQVERRKCAESERSYLAEKARSEALEKKLQEMEEQLYSTNVENDAIKEKFLGMVSDRDEQIKRLNNELERMRIHEEGEFQHINLGSPPKRASFSSKETAEVFLQDTIARLKEKHEHELATLMSVNANNIKQIREQYEQRIQELESWNVLETQPIDESSTKNYPDEKLIQSDEQSDERGQQILELQRKIETFQMAEMEMEKVKEQKEKLEMEKATQSEEIRRLRALNGELMASYNEASSQLEEARSNSHNQQADVSDLSSKIATLKSLLNETETRYELCKMDQNETSARLEQLMKEFHELRSSMQASRANAEGTEQELMAELHSLREGLKNASVDREKLIANFSQSMGKIDEELTQLRDCNRRLVDENVELGKSLVEFESLRDALNVSNEELGIFRAKFAQMQSNYMEQISQLGEERDHLRQSLEQLQQQQVQGSLGPEKECKTTETDQSFSSSDTMTNTNALLEQNLEQLKADLKEKEEELQRLKSEKVSLVSSIQSEEHFKRPSSDTDSAASNNDWERMGKEEIEVEGVGSSVGSDDKETATHSDRKRVDLKESGTQSEEMLLNDQIELKQKLSHLEEKLEEAKSELNKVTGELADSRIALIQSIENEQRVRNLIHEKDQELVRLTQERDSFGSMNVENGREIDALKTECEKLKMDFDQQLKERELEWLHQVELLETRLTKMMESNECLASENANLLAENERQRMQIAKIEEESESWRSQLSTEEADRSGIMKEMERKGEEVAKLADQNRELEAKLAQIEQDKMADLDQAAAGLAQQTEELSLARTEIEEMKTLLQQKHSECQDYYEKLQEIHSSYENKELKLKNAEETLQRREQEIGKNRERIAKLESELHRLRDHLLTVEEISSKEAIAAEERETDLRRQIRQLQEKSSNEESSIANSLEQYQTQIEELNSRVTALDLERTQLASALEEKEATQRETNKTLANLQMVLKELADDQRRERQQFDAELRKSRADLKEATLESAELSGTKNELEAELTALKDELTLLQEQLHDKEALLEELENQMEEARMSGKDAHPFSPSDPTSTSHSGGKTSLYKIDDATLRQLFFSYFTAEKSKQPEIALVMSRILGYSAEEQSHIEKALQQSSSSWFGFGGGTPSGLHGTHSDTSLTEQFVRFLEQESMARAAQSIILPVHTDQTQTGGGFLIGESPPVPTSSSSSYDLKSILDQ